MARGSSGQKNGISGGGSRSVVVLVSEATAEVVAAVEAAVVAAGWPPRQEAPGLPGRGGRASRPH